MRRKGTWWLLWLVAVVSLFAWAGAALADEGGGEESAGEGPARTEAVRGAVERGLRIVETAARNYPTHRQCFACHHQTLPMLAMDAAGKSGIAFDEELFQAQHEFTRASFLEREEQLRQGQGIGGRSMTVAYGLWTLEVAAAEPDELSEALAAFLLQNQEEDGRWTPPSNRPPLEESDVMCTVLAAYGLERYASADQGADAAVQRAKAWLKEAPLASTEDHLARLWGAFLFGEGEDAIAAARGLVLDLQQEDGSWGQIPGMAGDAYSTGQALFLLHETGLEPDDPAFANGIDFLLSTQEEDGSWFVQTRSKPVQVFFDNGDPHGASQFISIPATSWAVAALARAMP